MRVNNQVVIHEMIIMFANIRNGLHRIYAAPSPFAKFDTRHINSKPRKDVPVKPENVWGIKFANINTRDVHTKRNQIALPGGRSSGRAASGFLGARQLWKLFPPFPTWRKCYAKHYL